MKVQNVIGTSERNVARGSWINNWNDFTKQTASICRAVGCVNPASVGAHVKKCDSPDKTEYIVALCYTHNTFSQCFDISMDTDFISVNKKNLE